MPEANVDISMGNENRTCGAFPAFQIPWSCDDYGFNVIPLSLGGIIYWIPYDGCKKKTCLLAMAHIEALLGHLDIGSDGLGSTSVW